MTDRKEKALVLINSDVFLNEDVKSNFHKSYNRCYALVTSDGNIINMKATKKGAETILDKKKQQTYYSQNQQKMMSVGAGLEIIEITEKDIEPIDSPQLWYNTLQRLARELAGRSFPVERLRGLMKRHHITEEEVVRMLEDNWEDMQAGEIFINQRYEENWLDIEDKLFYRR